MKRKNGNYKSGLLLLLAALLTGCGAADTDGDASAETPDAYEEQIPETDSAETDSAEEADALTAPTAFLADTDMALADMWAGCDDRAVAAVMRKAAAGEDVTIACIGGSITQGTVSNGSKDSEVGTKKAYAEYFFDWWRTRFPDTTFTFVNAGIGATDSYLGVHRLKKDVLSKEPDLVLVEYAVNDANDAFYKKSYDNLLYNLLTEEDAPAVMCLFMAQTNGATAQTNEVLVGYHYSVPMLSYANVIADMMETGRYSAKELSGDEVHPSALGHAVTGEILWNYLNEVYSARDTLEAPEDAADVEALTKAVYRNADILDGSNITPSAYGDFTEETVCQQFTDGWGCNGEGGIVFQASFSRLGILYYATVEGKSGQFEVLIDGEAVRTVNADFSGGWGNAIKATEVYASDEVAEHTVELRRSADSTGDIFHLLGLMTAE